MWEIWNIILVSSNRHDLENISKKGMFNGVVCSSKQKEESRGIHIGVLVYATEILPSIGHLNDKGCIAPDFFLFPGFFT